MKVHAIYDRENKFVAAFPDRDSAENFGMDVLGLTNGWQYSIVEKYLHQYPTFLSTTSNTLTPYSQPIAPPYNHNIWRESNGPTATYEGETK